MKGKQAVSEMKSEIKSLTEKLVKGTETRRETISE